MDMKDVRWDHWHNCNGHNREWDKKNEQVFMGYSMRMHEWRYTAWYSWETR
jgi:hypothetical protein